MQRHRNAQTTINESSEHQFKPNTFQTIDSANLATLNNSLPKLNMKMGPALNDYEKSYTYRGQGGNST